MSWKADYFAELNKPKIDEVNLDATRMLKRQHLPKYLYRYRSLDPAGRTLKSLEDGATWLSAPANFNDPFDCALSISSERYSRHWHARELERMLLATGHSDKFTSDEKAEITRAPDSMTRMVEIAFEKDGNPAPADVAAVLKTLSEEILGNTLSAFGERLRDNVRVCCFCENATSILMWSHYAKDHTGFCLEYEMEPWVSVPVLFNLLHPVHYSEIRFDATDHVSPAVPPNVYVPTIAACNKSKDWEYEQEWRLVYPGGVMNKDPVVRLPNPSRIILGAKSDDKLRMTLAAIPRFKGIELVKASLSKTAFAVEIGRPASP